MALLGSTSQLTGTQWPRAVGAGAASNQRIVRAIEANEAAAGAEYVKRNLRVIGTGGSMIERVAIEALQWATIDNARVMRLDHKVGSLTPGKQADLIVVRRDSFNMLGVHDPVGPFCSSRRAPTSTLF